MLTEHPEDLVGGRLVDFNSGWNNLPDGRYVPYLEGFLVGAYRNVWDELGKFDEQYFPCDFEDVCLSTMALYQGRKLVELQGDYFSHLSGGSIGNMDGKRRAITESHRQLWLKKWEGKWDKILGANYA
jgi:GT2 family glycosyltransferase